MMMLSSLFFAYTPPPPFLLFPLYFSSLLGRSHLLPFCIIIISWLLGGWVRWSEHELCHAPHHVHYFSQLISPSMLSHTIAISPHPHCNCPPFSTIAFMFSHCLWLVVVFFYPGLIIVDILITHAPPLSLSSNLIVVAATIKCPHSFMPSL